jgi:voltage-gated potassium channel Kch
LLLVGAFGLGFGGFLLGAGTSERPGIPQSGSATQLYYALGLFVFGGLDLGVPCEGAALARSMLWIAYFACPAITTAAVVESLWMLLQPQRWLRSRLMGHVVIAGAGELARLYLEELRRVAPKQTVVVLTLGDGAEAEELRLVYGARVLVGDVTRPTVLQQAAVERAARVLLLTGDDLANIEAAHLVSEWVDPAQVITHVADISLLRSLETAHVPWCAGLFNAHQIAARHVVSGSLIPAFDRTPQADVLVLCGFGRFGQSLLAELALHAAGKLQRVLVVDLDATKLLRIFREQVPLGIELAIDALDGDERDPLVWQRVSLEVPLTSVFVLASNDERANLQVALWLVRSSNAARVIVRTHRRSAFVRVMAQLHGFEAAVISEHLRESLRASSTYGLKC